MKVRAAVKYRMTCRHCGSELEFELHDIQFLPNAIEPFGFVDCPVCGRTNKTHYGGYYCEKDSFRLLDNVEIIYEPEEGMLPPNNDKEGGPEHL